MTERRRKKAPPIVADLSAADRAPWATHVWPLTELEGLLSQDPGGRGIADLICPGDLGRAAEALAGSGRVLIATGFAVGPNGAAETDGPPGALFLGRALSRLGKDVIFATHRSCEPVMATGLASLGLLCPLLVSSPGEEPEPLLDEFRPDLVMAVELPGRSADGQYHNMRGEVISHQVSPLDGLLLQAAARTIPTVAVGDGGNEAGMGKVRERVRSAVRFGDRIACTVPADHLIVSGISNWGCYALLAGLGSELLHSPEEEVDLLVALTGAGALDGVRLESCCSVDGVQLEPYLKTLADLRRLVI